MSAADGQVCLCVQVEEAKKERYIHQNAWEPSLDTMVSNKNQC